MSAEHLDALLDRLSQGDAAAAGEVFVAYAPYLRMVVRRQLSAKLRAKFDSVDVVQSVWADLMRGFRRGAWHFDDATQLRAFLIKATRHRFLNRLRRHRRCVEHEQPLPGAGALPLSAQPRPSEVAQADDLWERLLAACPAQHHELLRLKRQGLALDEIAARTGLHPSSVRRVLYDLARRVASLPGAPAWPAQP
jgi:RNA polymerase sigma-70 factor (ECF subfamily)